ncbi:MAG: hypothetical protein ACRCTZ_03755 [Sarcina sp.]
MMGQLYFYQLSVCDYFSQYYESENTNKKELLYYAQWSNMLCRWFEKNSEVLKESLKSFVKEKRILCDKIYRGTVVDEIEDIIEVYSSDVVFLDKITGDIKKQVEKYGIEIYSK